MGGGGGGFFRTPPSVERCRVGCIGVGRVFFLSFLRTMLDFSDIIAYIYCGFLIVKEGGA